MAFVPEIGLEKAFGPALVRFAVSYNLGAKMNQAPAAYNQTSATTVTKNTDTQSSKFSAIGIKVGVGYQF
jgi:Cu/Ag efflux protein CusF